MPDNLVCPICKRVYPWQVPKERCASCHHEFTRGTCYVCREYKEELWHGLCKDCGKNINKRFAAKARATVHLTYDEWVVKVASVPKPHQYLTESEWIHTCTVFNGCAICGKPEIETRMMVVPVRKGGSYTRFNVIPACEHCATRHRTSIKVKRNIFIDIHEGHNQASKNKLNRLVDYLQKELEEYDKQRTCIHGFHR